MTNAITPPIMNLADMYEKLHNTNADYQQNNQGLACWDAWWLKLQAPGAVVRGLPLRLPSVIEVGCGNGLLCQELAKRGCQTTGVDLAVGPYERRDYEFYQMNVLDLCQFSRRAFDFSLCFDVLEHLPEEFIGEAIPRIVDVGRRYILSVACYGNPPMHLTVKSPGWWLDKMLSLCPSTDWQVLKVWKRNHGGLVALFYGEKDE